MKIIPFYVPIFQYKIKNWNVKKKQLLDLFYSLEHRVIDNVITSPIDIKTNILLEEVKIFEKEIGINFYSTEVWFQKYDINMYHEVHTHGPTGFSSVCFIEYDKDNHKPTTFVSPFINYINGGVASYEPNVEEGDIIFFPSNILHYSPTNSSNKMRTIISFNLTIKSKPEIKLSYE